jgi:hypothetical protein
MPPEPTDFIKGMLERAAPLMAEDFKGATTDGKIVPGLFSLATTVASLSTTTSISRTTSIQ